MIPTPWGEAEFRKYLDGYMYFGDAFNLDAVLSADRDGGTITAVSDTKRRYLATPFQQGDPKTHPRHVSGADMLMMTANLGSLHAYFFHDCSWEGGWVGFGGRIERAEFRRLASIGNPLELRSREVKVRKRSTRVVIEYEFTFSQDGAPVYESRQTAMFVKNTL